MEAATLRPLGTPTNAAYSVAVQTARVSMGWRADVRQASRTGSTDTLDDSWANAPDEVHGQLNMDEEVLR